MSNKEYYERWLKIKNELKQVIFEDGRVNDLALHEFGIKPQATAVEIVARVYSKYCQIYNNLCDCYDQMEQVQRRPYIKTIIDAVTCRILELKTTLEEIEIFEFTYPENALQQLLMTPQEARILCPFFYPFEIRQEEMQYIVDQIMAGNRIGAPKPTTSELERQEDEIRKEKIRKQEEKEAEIKKKIALGEEKEQSLQVDILSPAVLESLRLKMEYEGYVNDIQRMERSRKTWREKMHKINNDTNLYIELAGLKNPPARKEIRVKAAQLIQFVYRKFMGYKREHVREYNLRMKLGMYMPPLKSAAVKIKLEEVKEQRRKFRQNYHLKLLEENMKENTRVLRLREGNIMEDITAEIKQWFQEWYDAVRVFDEFPWPEEGGSILIVTGQTFSIEEYIDWRTAEEKRLKAAANAPKSKDQIKAEKAAAKEEKKRLALEAKEKQKKKLEDYRKSRLNPDNDPGVYVTIGKMLEPVKHAWDVYQSQWKQYDYHNAPINVLKGFIKEIITENAFQNVQLELRKIVDETMRLELTLLRNALKVDLANAGGDKLPLIKKRKKPKKVKTVKPDKVSPAEMFQTLVDEGIIRKYPHTTLDEYWGDLNYAAADMRAVMWTPSFPSPCIGDVREQVRTRCLLTLGCDCPNATRSQLIVGPKSSGKRTLIYAIATETNSILIDLSPFNVYNKFPGPKNMKLMFNYVTKISKLMQPTVIMIDNADKLFYKKVPKEEKIFDPTRLSKDIYKEIIKPIEVHDKILVLGTASEPWLAKGAPMYKVFPSVILIPRTDYGSLTYVLSKILMKYHGVPRDFNVHSVAQVLRGYNISAVRKAMEELLDGKRVAALYHKPLNPVEIIEAVVECNTTIYTGTDDYELFNEWYYSYSPWGKKYLDYMIMLESQLAYKLKADKKKKKV